MTVSLMVKQEYAALSAQTAAPVFFIVVRGQDRYENRRDHTRAAWHVPTLRT